MKRLICSAAVASVLLGASVIPSGANTVIGTDATFTSPGAFDNPVGFGLGTPEKVNIAGSINGSPDTPLSVPPFSVTLIEPSPPPVSISVVSGVWNETFTLAAGAYSLVFTGTAPTGT